MKENLPDCRREKKGRQNDEGRLDDMPKRLKSGKGGGGGGGGGGGV